MEHCTPGANPVVIRHHNHCTFPYILDNLFQHYFIWKPSMSCHPFQIIWIYFTSCPLHLLPPTFFTFAQNSLPGFDEKNPSFMSLYFSVTYGTSFPSCSTSSSRTRTDYSYKFHETGIDGGSENTVKLKFKALAGTLEKGFCRFEDIFGSGRRGKTVKYTVVTLIVY